MASTVFFADMRASLKRPFNSKLDELMDRVGLESRIRPGAQTAIKIHFGERGNTAFIRPVLARRFVDAVKRAGGKAFFTDCNTLYVGSRAEAVDHLRTAVENGFAYSVVGAPLIIADGLRGASETAVRVDLPECEFAYIGSEIANAEALISLAHFKGHEVAGFGGSIKNLGMGCASRRGKLFQHSNISPTIRASRCIACGQCVKRCPGLAIKLVKRDAAMGPAPADSPKPELCALKDPTKCIGCGDCILACPQMAIEIAWDAQIPQFMRRMAAYTKGVLAGKERNCVFFNFITNVSPTCDCYPFQDAPIVNDIGVVASTDPVAIDQASVDLVNRAVGLPHSCLKHAHASGGDKFRDVHPKIDWDLQLEAAEEAGVGLREYELVTI